MSCSIFSKIHNKKDVFTGRFKVILKKKIPFYPSVAAEFYSATASAVTKKIEFFFKKIWSVQKKVVSLYQKTRK